MHNVCRFFIDNKITDAALYKMSNEEIIHLLTQIKGVGKWTVEMILMFTLGREDIFAFDDLGLKQSVIKLYKIKETDKKLLLKKMETISVKWKPYRTYACRYLWGWKDGIVLSKKIIKGFTIKYTNSCFTSFSEKSLHGKRTIFSFISFLS